MTTSQLDKLLAQTKRLSKEQLEALAEMASKEAHNREKRAKKQLYEKKVIPKDQWTYADLSIDSLRAELTQVHDLRQYSHLFQPKVVENSKSPDKRFSARSKTADGRTIDSSGPIVLWDQQAPPVDFPSVVVDVKWNGQSREWERHVKSETQKQGVLSFWHRRIKEEGTSVVLKPQPVEERLYRTDPSRKSRKKKGRTSARQDALFQAIQQWRRDNHPHRPLLDMLDEVQDIRERAEIVLKKVSRIKKHLTRSHLTEEEKFKRLYQEAESEWLGQLEEKLERHRYYMQHSQWDEDYYEDNAKGYEKHLLLQIANGFQHHLELLQSRKPKPLKVKLGTLSRFRKEQKHK